MRKPPSPASREVDREAIGARRALTVEHHGDASDTRAGSRRPLASSMESAYSYCGEISMRRAPPSPSETAAMAFCAAGVMRDRGLLELGRRGAEHFVDLAAGVQLFDDVAAADELALDVELREGGPARVLFHALAQVGALQDVDVAKLAHARLAQDADDGGREAALRKVLRALHEQNDLIAFEGDRRSPASAALPSSLPLCPRPSA